MSEVKHRLLNSIIIYGIIFFLLFIIINHFLFKITEYSENAYPSLAPNSKVVVNLLTYHIKPIERWDIAYLENKDNSDQFLARRIVGLPNEKVYLKNGDVYIDNMLQQKHSELQKGLWQPNFNLKEQIKQKGLKPEELFTTFQNDFWKLEEDGTLRTNGVGRGSIFLNSAKIGDQLAHDYCISLDITFNKNQGQIYIMCPYYDKQLLLNLPSAGVQKNAHIQEEMKILKTFSDIQLKPGITYHVELWLYDRKVEVYIDNQRLFRQNWGKDTIREKQLNPTSVFIGTMDSDASITNFEVKKDIYFAANGRYGCDPEIPYKLNSKQYFVITENKETSSSDSRSFGAVSLDLIKGRVILTLYPNFLKWVY